MDTRNRFSEFAPAIRALDPDWTVAQPLPSSLLLASANGMSVYYAPFDYFVDSARVLLVGITPGRQQAVNAIGAARRALLAGDTDESACMEAKSVASFSGGMRRNLIDLLDHVGVARKLGIGSTDRFWTDRGDLVHFTSVLRYPVFDNGANYSGQRILASDFLKNQIESWFASECKALPEALVVPLGPAAADACQWLTRLGMLDSNRILVGIPHPSGANNERISYFLGRKPADRLSTKVNALTLDRGRSSAMQRVHSWNGTNAPSVSLG